MSSSSAHVQPFHVVLHGAPSGDLRRVVLLRSPGSPSPHSGVEPSPWGPPMLSESPSLLSGMESSLLARLKLSESPSSFSGMSPFPASKDADTGLPLASKVPVLTAATKCTASGLTVASLTQSCWEAAVGLNISLKKPSNQNRSGQTATGDWLTATGLTATLSRAGCLRWGAGIGTESLLGIGTGSRLLLRAGTGRR